MPWIEFILGTVIVIQMVVFTIFTAKNITDLCIYSRGFRLKMPGVEEKKIKLLDHVDHDSTKNLIVFAHVMVYGFLPIMAIVYSFTVTKDLISAAGKMKKADEEAHRKYIEEEFRKLRLEEEKLDEEIQENSTVRQIPMRRSRYYNSMKEFESQHNIHRSK